MKIIFFGAVAIVLEIIIIITMYYGLHGNIDSQRAQIESNRALLVNYGFEKNDLVDIDWSAQLIKQEIALLGAINENRPDIPLLLKILGTKLPGSMWLNQFKVQQNKTEIVGFARSTKNLNEFMESLRASKIFRSLEMKSLKKITLLKSKILMFELFGEVS